MSWRWVDKRLQPSDRAKLDRGVALAPGVTVHHRDDLDRIQRDWLDSRGTVCPWETFQHVVDEGIRLTPDIPIGERTATSKGNRVFRVEAPAGPFEVSYRATVEVKRPAVPAEVTFPSCAFQSAPLL